MVQQFWVKGSLDGPKNLQLDEYDLDLLSDGPVNYFPRELACIGARIFVISRQNLPYFLFCLVFKAANEEEDDDDEEEADANGSYMLYKPNRAYESAYYGALYDSIENGTYYMRFSSEERESNENLDKALDFRHAILSHFDELPNFIYINRY